MAVMQPAIECATVKELCHPLWREGFS